MLDVANPEAFWADLCVEKGIGNELRHPFIAKKNR
jgi:hypothetical protein